jgi:outer membrane protein TolC
MKGYRTYLKQSFSALILCIFVIANLRAQDSLTIDEVYKTVWANHPLARQAVLIPELFFQDARYQRGFFDPVATAEWYRKDFKGKNYYNKFIAEAKIPTFLGFDIKGGFETHEGYYLNPESNVPTEGLAYLGISLPLMRSLFFDERRAALRKAQIFHQLSFAEKQKALASLFWKVTSDYWGWYSAYEIMKINQVGIDLAMKRFEFVRGAYAGGKYAAIDTTEALMEYRRRLVDYEKAVLDWKNAAISLSVHLYDENGQMLLIGEDLKPSERFVFPDGFTEVLRTSALPNHPEILKNQFKQQAYKIDEKLAFFNLLPIADVEFKPLFMPTSPNINLSNHKIGANFYVPLFLRKERAKLASVKIKIKQQEQELIFAKQSVQNYFEQVFNEWNAYQKIVKAQKDNTESAYALTNAEQEKFELGISNVFLINYRERYLLDNKIKLVELQSKYFSTFAKLYYAAGTFPPVE